MNNQNKKLRRKKINASIRSEALSFWTEDKRAFLNKEIRKTIFKTLEELEEKLEPQIQDWAHKVVNGNSLIQHADRMDLKRSLRKYLREQSINVLGLQKFFPELYENSKDKSNPDNPSS